MSGLIGGRGSKSGIIGITEGKKPGFMAYHSGADIDYSVGDIIPFGGGSSGTAGGKQFDTMNNFDNTTNYRFTAPIAGVYLFTGQINGNADSGVPRARWRINGGSIGNDIHFRGCSNLAAGDLDQRSYTVILKLQKNDYVDVYVHAEKFDLFGANSMSGHLLS
mgnify:CR=1 FL=1|jgi:hypothetical protein|tara:strand:- start:301 stop:789 length:489 start_codon:yes stop_codon:yes gene_type:complete